MRPAERGQWMEGNPPPARAHLPVAVGAFVTSQRAKAPTRTRILLADADHDLYAKLTLLLEEIAPRRFVLEWASTYGFAVTTLRRQAFDLCLVGSHIGHRSGTELVRHLRASSPGTPALLLANDEEMWEAIGGHPVECLDRHRLTVEMLRQAIRDLLFRPTAGTPVPSSLTHPSAAETVPAEA